MLLEESLNFLLNNGRIEVLGNDNIFGLRGKVFDFLVIHVQMLFENKNCKLHKPGDVTEYGGIQ